MTAADPKKIVVLIVTYNARKYLDGLFGTLAKREGGPHDVEILVVDNASTDGTADAIAAAYPWARLIRNPRNSGFAGGNNVGLRQVIEAGADFVYLLNQDTEVEPNFLLEALAVAGSAADVGSIQSLLLLHPERDRVNSAGNAIHFLGFGYCRDNGRRLTDVKLGEREIAYGSGAGLLLSAAALRRVGLLDEELFMYHEDLDLGWRLRLAGFRNLLAPRSVVYHKYEFSRSVAKFYYMERNRYLVLWRNFRLWTMLLLLPWLILSEFGLLAAAVRSGWWREKFRVYAYFFRPAAWRHIRSGRREVAKFRQVGDREIVRLFTPVIAYQEVAGPFTRYVANPLMTVLWSVLRLFII
ncbi:MAG: glycosyltransferase family 2 protein [Patescibacteria group bacterium]|jgi:GT2 family glycosyltransferase